MLAGAFGIRRRVPRRLDSGRESLGHLVRDHGPRPARVCPPPGHAVHPAQGARARRSHPARAAHRARAAGRALPGRAGRGGVPREHPGQAAPRAGRLDHRPPGGEAHAGRAHDGHLPLHVGEEPRPRGGRGRGARFFHPQRGPRRRGLREHRDGADAPRGARRNGEGRGAGPVAARARVHEHRGRTRRGQAGARAGGQPPQGGPADHRRRVHRGRRSRCARPPCSPSSSSCSRRTTSWTSSCARAWHGRGRATWCG